MLAEKQNYEICEAIIEMFHKKAQDTKVGELVKISYEDFL